MCIIFLSHIIYWRVWPPRVGNILGLSLNMLPFHNSFFKWKVLSAIRNLEVRYCFMYFPFMCWQIDSRSEPVTFFPARYHLHTSMDYSCGAFICIKISGRRYIFGYLSRSQFSWYYLVILYHLTLSHLFPFIKTHVVCISFFSSSSDLVHVIDIIMS